MDEGSIEGIPMLEDAERTARIAGPVAIGCPA